MGNQLITYIKSKRLRILTSKNKKMSMNNWHLDHQTNTNIRKLTLGTIPKQIWQRKYKSINRNHILYISKARNKYMIKFLIYLQK